MNREEISDRSESHEMIAYGTFHSTRYSPYVNMSPPFTTDLIIDRTCVTPAIHESVLKRDLNTLRVLLRTKTSQVNATDSFGNTPLHYAVISDDDRFFEMLLKHPAININLRNHANRTPLHWALGKSNVNAIKTLVRRKDIQLDGELDREGYSCREIFIQKHAKLATKLLNLQPRELLKALRENQWDQFVKILDQRNDHVYYFYPTDQPGTLLDIACRSPGNGKFVKVLLEREARINAINPSTGKAAIHEAVLYSDAETLRILMQDDDCHVDVLDVLGNSVLHHAVRRNNAQILEILLERNASKNRSEFIQKHVSIDIDKKPTRIMDQIPESHRFINVNAIDQSNRTPLHVALLENKLESIDILLDQPNIDVDAQKDLRDRTCRQIIVQSFPKLEPKLPQTASKSNLIESLFSLLHKRDIETFVERIQSVKLSSTITNGQYTYLQYACKEGMIEVVRGLLEAGINPNGFSPASKLTPAMIASHEGYHEILSMLLNHPSISFEPIESKTVLHSVMEGMLREQDAAAETGNISSNENRDHYQCLQYILGRVIQNGNLDINYSDENGSTALHMAVSLNDYQVLKDLLDNGAYLSQKNNSGVEPVRMMNPVTLQQYLNSCITSEGQLMRDNYKIIFNYRSLIPPNSLKIPEITTVNVMSNEPDLRPLLEHPVIRSYLNIKWQALKIYAYVNLAFYTFFWLFLNLYFYDYFVRYRKSDSEFSEIQFQLLLRTMTGIAWMILVLRELYQYLLAPKLYLRSFMNYLEWILISFVFIFLTCQTMMKLDQTKKLAGLTIIFSSLELITLVGRLPTFSRNLPMVTAVASVWFKFVSWYAILFLGLAFAFSILDTIGVKQMDIPLNQPATFLYNVTIMLTGRLNPPSVTNDSSLRLYNILFLSVVLLAAIVNGLALSGVVEVRQNAVVLGIISQIRSTYRTESMAVEDAYGLLRALDKLAGFLSGRRTSSNSDRTSQQIFYRRIRLADYIRPSYQIAIQPNRRNAVLLPLLDSSGFRKVDSHFDKKSWIVDSTIVADASTILETRNTPSNVLSRGDLEKVEQSIENIMSILKTKLK